MSLIKGVLTLTNNYIEAGIKYELGQIMLPDGDYIINASISAKAENKSGVSGLSIHLVDRDNDIILSGSTASDNITISSTNLTCLVSGLKTLSLYILSGSDVRIDLHQLVACKINNNEE